MKYLLLLLIVAFTSCKKCYQCTTTIKSYNTWGDLYMNRIVGITNFCGTSMQKNKHEKESSNTVYGYSKAKDVTTMECIAD